jgi:cytoskeletal protein RodZ
MRSAAVILAGLLAGVLVALGVLAAFLFVGPDPVGLRPTPSPQPSVEASASPSPSASPSALPSQSPSVSAPPAGSPSPSVSTPPAGSPSPSVSPAGSASGSPGPSGSDASQTAFHVGRLAPALVMPQLGTPGGIGRT